MVTTMLMVYLAAGAAVAYALWTQSSQQKPVRIKVEEKRQPKRRINSYRDDC